MEMTVKLTDSEVSNLIESIRSGAISYWGSVAGYPSGALKMRIHDSETSKGHTLTRTKLEKGVALAILNCATVGAQLHNGVDACDHSAVDCMIQYALFGKLVYG